MKKLLLDNPLAAAVFVRWLMARNTMEPVTPYLRTPFTDLPFELAYGVLVQFFQEQGVVIGTRCSSKGRVRVLVYQKRRTGTFELKHNGKWKATIGEAVREGCRYAFMFVQRRLKPIETTDDDGLLVGLDVEKFLSEHEG